MNKEDIIRKMQEAGLKPPARGEFIFIHWDQIAMLLEHERAAIKEALAEQPAQQPHCNDCGGFDPECPLAQPVQQEIEELTAQRDKLADILTRTANALKGQPAELSLHSWHDLPEVAQQLKAAQQQEPLCNKDPRGCWSVRCQLGKVCKNTSPPASKPWVGLTDKEFQWIYDNGRTPAGMIEMAEAKLREKNV